MAGHLRGWNIIGVHDIHDSDGFENSLHVLRLPGKKVLRTDSRELKLLCKDQIYSLDLFLKDVFDS